MCKRLSCVCICQSIVLCKYTTLYRVWEWGYALVLCMRMHAHMRMLTVSVLLQHLFTQPPTCTLHVQHMYSTWVTMPQCACIKGIIIVVGYVCSTS